jgi:hypothetical protein
VNSRRSGNLDATKPVRSIGGATKHVECAPTDLTRSMWTHSVQGGNDVPEPDWSSVREAIEALNGEARDEVSLVRYGPPRVGQSVAERQVLYMYGGAAGRVVVVMSTEVEGGSEWRRLAESGRGEGLIGGMVGQQWVDIPARYWVGKKLALDAAELFWREGSRSVAAAWEDPELQPEG